MAGKSPKLLIGVFLILGFLIGAAAIVWVSATQYFKKGDLYLTYFDESVQGLQKDSPVKYRGLTVGSVASIQVAPDNRLIEVQMKLELERALSSSIVAQLTQIGITGLVFIDLNPIRPGDRERLLKPDFAATIPVIASRLSNLRQLELNIEQVMAKVQEIDLARITGRIEKAASVAERTLAGPRMERIMANLDSLSAALAKTAHRVDRITARGEIEDILDNAAQALRGSRSAVERIGREVDSLKISETAEKIDRAISEIEASSRRMTGNVKKVGSNLERASDTLNLLLDRLEKNPSELLFSQPPPPGRSE